MIELENGPFSNMLTRIGKIIALGAVSHNLWKSKDVILQKIYK